jgi:altronate hydrolase
VIIAKVSLDAGTWVETEDGPVKLREDIAAGHKIAFRSRAAGEAVRRYGQIIGVAAAPIRAGDRVHTHNVRRGEVEHDYRARCDARPVVLHPPEAMRTFEGYARPGGRVGTRNYVAVVSTVNCVASVARFVSERFRDVSRDYPGVDGVVALTHRGGCGHIADGEDHLLIERVLAGYARHPNVAAYVIVGLGCEVAQPETLIARQGSMNGALSLEPPSARKRAPEFAQRRPAELGFSSGRIGPSSASAEGTARRANRRIPTRCGFRDSQEFR